MRGLNKWSMVVQVYAIAHIAVNVGYQFHSFKLILSLFSLFLQRVHVWMRVHVLD